MAPAPLSHVHYTMVQRVALAALCQQQQEMRLLRIVRTALTMTLDGNKQSDVNNQLAAMVFGRMLGSDEDEEATLQGILDDSAP